MKSFVTNLTYYILCFVLIALVYCSVCFADEAAAANSNPDPNEAQQEETEAQQEEIYGLADHFSGYVSLYSDRSARRVGDIVTIIIVHTYVYLTIKAPIHGIISSGYRCCWHSRMNPNPRRHISRILFRGIPWST